MVPPVARTMIRLDFMPAPIAPRTNSGHMAIDFAQIGAISPNLRGEAVGRLAQLVEHLVYTERVGGSSPSPPTSFARLAFVRGTNAAAKQIGRAAWRERVCRYG